MRTRKTIPIPQSWTLPKYQLGQITKQGQIVGIEYVPSSKKWLYWIDVEPETLSSFNEWELEPLEIEELKARIEDHRSQIQVLAESLDAIDN
jgi:hypothetical protein